MPTSASSIRTATSTSCGMRPANARCGSRCRTRWDSAARTAALLSVTQARSTAAGIAAMSVERVVITGSGAICGAGRTPDEILQAIVNGRSAIGPISQWDPGAWPVRIAAEVTDYNAGALTGDRKLLKFIRRTDVFGLYAADRALDEAALPAWRDSLEGD